MLKKQYRLNLKTSARSPRLSRGLPSSFESPYFFVRVSKSGLTSKFGFSISKNVDKRAVVRNRVKRTISQALEENLGRLTGAYHMVFYAKKKAADLPREELKRSVKDFLLQQGFSHD